MQDIDFIFEATRLVFIDIFDREATCKRSSWVLSLESVGNTIFDFSVWKRTEQLLV